MASALLTLSLFSKRDVLIGTCSARVARNAAFQFLGSCGISLMRHSIMAYIEGGASNARPMCKDDVFQRSMPQSAGTVLAEAHSRNASTCSLINTDSGRVFFNSARS